MPASLFDEADATQLLQVGGFDFYKPTNRADFPDQINISKFTFTSVHGLTLLMPKILIMLPTEFPRLYYYYILGFPPTLRNKPNGSIVLEQRFCRPSLMTTSDNFLPLFLLL